MVASGSPGPGAVSTLTASAEELNKRPADRWQPDLALQDNASPRWELMTRLPLR